MLTLFITRNLEGESPLLDWATRTGGKVIGQSLLRFAQVDFQVPKDADWWFFYSPRAVEFSATRLALLPMPLPKLAAMGPGTARALLTHDYVLRADFAGTGSPGEVAKAFGQIAAGQKVFFPRARQSRMTVQNLLQDTIVVTDAVCYDNQSVRSPNHVRADIYVFTSPLNVRTYLMAHELPVGARVIAIGPSSAQALASFGVRCEVAEESSELGVRALLGA